MERIAHFLAHWSFRVIAEFREDQGVAQKCSRASPNSLPELSKFRSFQL